MLPLGKEGQSQPLAVLLPAVRELINTAYLSDIPFLAFHVYLAAQTTRSGPRDVTLSVISIVAVADPQARS